MSDWAAARHESRARALEAQGKAATNDRYLAELARNDPEAYQQEMQDNAVGILFLIGFIFLAYWLYYFYTNIYHSFYTKIVSPLLEAFAISVGPIPAIAVLLVLLCVAAVPPYQCGKCNLQERATLSGIWLIICIAEMIGILIAYIHIKDFLFGF